MASSAPATSAKVVFGVSLLTSLALDRPKLITFEPPPCRLDMTKNRKIPIRMMGRNENRIDSSGFSRLILVE